MDGQSFHCHRDGRSMQHKKQAQAFHLPYGGRRWQIYIRRRYGLCPYAWKNSRCRQQQDVLLVRTRDRHLGSGSCFSQRYERLNLEIPSSVTIAVVVTLALLEFLGMITWHGEHWMGRICVHNGRVRTRRHRLVQKYSSQQTPYDQPIVYST